MPHIMRPKQWMLDTLYDSELIVRDSITDTSRWSIQHELIFKHDGKLYRAYYNVGATEYQDESPWQDEDEITCVEVMSVPSIDYKAVPEPAVPLTIRRR